MYSSLIVRVLAWKITTKPKRINFSMKHHISLFFFWVGLLGNPTAWAVDSAPEKKPVKAAKTAPVAKVAAPAKVETPLPDEAEKEHKRAVDIARDGKPTEGLKILARLSKQYPDNYSLYRDTIIITTWTDQCKEALTLYEKIKNRPNQEGYLISAVAECKANSAKRNERIRQLREAMAMISGAMQTNAQDEDLRQTLKTLKEDLKLETSQVVEASLNTSESQGGNRQWALSTRYTHRINDPLRVYARLFLMRAVDKEFATGDLDRAGIGLTYDFNEYLSINQDLSTDMRNSGEEGSTTTLSVFPNPLWSIVGEYATFAEDVPLRGKAEGATAKRMSLGTDFHTVDYRWLWGASISQYDFDEPNFTDQFGGPVIRNPDNQRTALSTYGEYALELKPQREQRLSLSLSSSKNTEFGRTYFNPEKDMGVILTYQLNIIFNTKLHRHVDTLSVYGGIYQADAAALDGPNNIQRSFSDPVAGIRYAQEYDFTKYTALRWGISYRSNVYDGNREGNTAADIGFVLRF